MPPVFSILIPTFNNPQYLNPCVQTISDTGVLGKEGELIIVNNGKQPIQEQFGGQEGIRVLDSPSNLGWEGGLEAGLRLTNAPFVVFQNDDTHIPYANRNFYAELLKPFSDKSVAAVGPTTTVAAGWHSTYMRQQLKELAMTSFLIFFTVMIRRSDLYKAGGIDTSAPGGDDFDLSIRLRKLGKKLVINPDAFIIHHGFKTGERVRGGAATTNGWNSQEMSDRTNRWLIQKHGFRDFFNTRVGNKALSNGH